MGMECGLIRAKSKQKIKEKEFDEIVDFDEIKDSNEFYSEDEGQLYPEVCNVWYARKFWDLVEAIPALKETLSQSDDYTRIKKQDLEAMIRFYSFHPDYFDGFAGLPRLCELYQEFDKMTKDGYNLYFWISY